jgi:hypothetical protein
MVISQTFHHCDKIPEQNNLRGKDLFWLKVSIHHGGAYMGGQSSSHTMAARKQRDRKTVLAGIYSIINNNK